MVAYIGTKELKRASLVPGYNAFSFSGMTAGKVRVDVVRGTTRILTGSGPKEV